MWHMTVIVLTEPHRRQADRVAVVRDDVLELLNLGLESKICSLQILDVLVLSLHGDDRHVKTAATDLFCVRLALLHTNRRSL